jgi:hypothetical protein
MDLYCVIELLLALVDLVARFRLRGNSALTNCSVGRIHPLRERDTEKLLLNYCTYAYI